MQNLIVNLESANTTRIHHEDTLVRGKSLYAYKDAESALLHVFMEDGKNHVRDTSLRLNKRQCLDLAITLMEIGAEL